MKSFETTYITDLETYWQRRIIARVKDLCCAGILTGTEEEIKKEIIQDLKENYLNLDFWQTVIVDKMIYLVHLIEDLTVEKHEEGFIVEWATTKATGFKEEG